MFNQADHGTIRVVLSEGGRLGMTLSDLIKGVTITEVEVRANPGETDLGIQEDPSRKNRGRATPPVGPGVGHRSINGTDPATAGENHLGRGELFPLF